jgi:hypothetical protein
MEVEVDPYFRDLSQDIPEKIEEDQWKPLSNKVGLLAEILLHGLLGYREMNKRKFL